MKQLAISPHQKSLSYNPKDTYFDIQMGRFDNTKPPSRTFRRVPTPKYESGTVFLNLSPKPASRAGSAPRLSAKTQFLKPSQTIEPQKKTANELKHLETLKQARQMTFTQLDKRSKNAENKLQQSMQSCKNIFLCVKQFKEEMDQISKANQYILNKISYVFQKINVNSLLIKAYKPPVLITKEIETKIEVINDRNSYNRTVPLIAYKQVKDEKNEIQKQLIDLQIKSQNDNLAIIEQRNSLCESQSNFEAKNREIVQLRNKISEQDKSLNEARDDYYKLTYEQNKEILNQKNYYEKIIYQQESQFKEEIQLVQDDYEEQISKLQMKIDELKRRKEVE